jgi:hypothetical protein
LARVYDSAHPRAKNATSKYTKTLEDKKYKKTEDTD